jgi:integrase
VGKDLTVAVRNFVALDNRVTEYQENDIAPSTRRVYDHAWQMFVNFLVPKDAWRAQPIDVARWMASQALRGVNPLTIEHRCGGLTYYYEKVGKGAAHGKPGVGVRETPVRDLLAQKTLQGIFRKHGRPPDRKLPLMLETLELMIDRQPNELLGLRNRVMLIIGWAAALRGGEISMLDAHPRGSRGNGWIDIHDDGLIVNLRRSKRNQHARRLEQYAVPARPHAPQHCPVQLLKAWLRASGIKSEPLFPCVRHATVPRRDRLSIRTIRYMVKRSAARLGIDPKLVSTRSSRAGCLSWLDEQRVPIHEIMKHAGHSKIESLRPYLRRPLKMRDSALAQTEWVR